MLVVTHHAAVTLLEASDGTGAVAGCAIRVRAFCNATGRLEVRLEPDEIAEGDKKVVFDGRVILIADSEAAAALSGRTLTVDHRDGQAKFSLRKTRTQDASTGVSDGE